MQLLFFQSHFQRAHALESTNGTAIAQREFRYLAFLTEFGILAVLLDRDAEHFAGRCAVDVLALDKGLKTPVLFGVPGDDAGFDSRIVGNDELIAVSSHKIGADQF